jgi:deoxyribonuclease-4
VLELGAHVSTAGGVDQAITRATEAGMTACQIFTKNQRQWRAKPLDPAEAERFRDQWAASPIKLVVAHDSYLINLASGDDALWDQSRLAFRDELDRCQALGVPWLVTHPGAPKESGPAAGIVRVAEALNRIHAERPDDTVLTLLETTAGQGTTLGRTFEELAENIALVEDQSRVGVCFDTCHVFAAGYEIRDPVGYAETMARFDAILGLARLRAVHLNDSRFPFGSRRDRHAHIGEGELGLAAFANVMNDERLAGLPGILETPQDDPQDDVRNLATLRGLVRTPVLTG